MFVVPASIPTTGGYVPAGAIWLDGSADYLSWTPSGAADSDTIWTASAWVKRAGLGSLQRVFVAGDVATGNNFDAIYFDANDKLNWQLYRSGVLQGAYKTTAVFRDTSAWMHVHVTRSGATVTISVNGEAITAFDTSTAPDAGDQSMFMQSGEPTTISYQPWGGTNRYNGYIAEAIMLDGTASAVSNFGKTDTNGNWVPIDPSGLTFGTNGFWLDFANSAALGTDASGNGNNFTVNSMSSANATNDNPADDATNGYGNFNNWNPASSGGNGSTFSNGNNTWSDASGSGDAATGIIAVSSGKWICEFEIDAVTAGLWLGVWGMETQTASTPFKPWDSGNDIAGDHGTWVIKPSTGYTVDGDGQGDPGTNQSLSTWTATDRLTIAIDMDQGAGSNKMWIAKNGTWENSGDPDGGTGAIFTNLPERAVFVVGNRGSGTDTVTMRADSATWEDSPSNATTFKDLYTANFPAPTVTDPSAYFGTLTWSGDNSYPRTVTGLTDGAGTAWTPDFAWGKPRDAVENHQVVDVVRGFDNYVNPDITSAENPNSYLSATSGGFSISAANDRWNKASTEHVAWFLKAGGSGSSNTDGSASSTVSVADHNGFAIIKHTNTSGDYTVGHGMGQAPDMLILKGLGTQGWLVWTADLGVDGYLGLHSNAAVANPAGDPWSDTSPTSSVFTIAGTTWYGGSSFDIVTYAFARTPGLIGIGSYTGNGSADGPYVVVDDGGSGFRPAWVMIKRTDSTGYWDIHDNARNPYNVVDKRLHANAADTEATAGTTAIDFVANGFKIRTGSVANINVSGGTYIYLAFAEYPFGGEGISQARAR